MMQQINLYQPLFRKQQKIFSAVTMLQAAAMVAVGMLAFFAYGIWQTHALTAQAEQAQKQRDEAAKRVAELARLYPQRSKDTALEQQVETLRNQVRVKQQVLAKLADRHEGNLHGFAAQLEGLARQRLPQLWLTRVGITHGGQSLELDGSALVPEEVPQYLQRLATETAFGGTEFRYFTMDRPEKSPQQVDFTIMTEAPKKAGK